MERNDLLTPFFNGKIRWTKPILIYWAMHLPISVFGNTEFAVRLPSVLAGVGGVLIVFYFLRQLRGRATALLGACILATLPQYLYMARQAMPDMLLTVFICGAMAFYALAHFGTGNRRLHLALFYASVALAFLTKGPVACVIVLAALGCFGLAHIDPQRHRSPKHVWTDLKGLLASHHLLLGTIIFVVLAGPWYLSIWLEHGYAFIDNFIIGENIHRFQAPVTNLDGNYGFYFKTLYYGMYPWVGVLPLFLTGYVITRRKRDAEFRQHWYYISWLLAILLLFSLAATKIDHYLLPLAPVVAVIVALAWERYLGPDAPRWIRWALLLSLVLTNPVHAVFTELTSGSFSVVDAVRANPAQYVLFFSWSLLILLCVCLPRRRTLVVLAIMIAGVNGIYFSHFRVPAGSKIRSLSHYVELYRKIKEPDATLVLYGAMQYHYSLLYYAPGEYTTIATDRPEALGQLCTQTSHTYIMANAQTLPPQLQDRLQSRPHLLSNLNQDLNFYACSPKHRQN